MPTSPTPCAVLVGPPSYLRGQYPHNHSILGTSRLEGGEKKFRQLGRDQSTIATWLDTRATGPSSHLPGQASILRPFLFFPLFTNGVEGAFSEVHHKARSDQELVAQLCRPRVLGRRLLEGLH